MGFVGLGSMIPTIHVFHVCFSFLSSILCLCCVVHITPMVKCLIGIFLMSLRISWNTMIVRSSWITMIVRSSWNTMIIKCISGYVFCYMP